MSTIHAHVICQFHYDAGLCYWKKKFRFLCFQANKSSTYYPNTKVWSIVDVKFGIEYDSTILVIYHDLIYIQQKYDIT